MAIYFINKLFYIFYNIDDNKNNYINKNCCNIYAFCILKFYIINYNFIKIFIFLKKSYGL